MYNGKYVKLCPLSFGVALGLTAAIAILVWSFWLEYMMPVMTIGHVMPTHSFMGTWILAGWCLLKGFVAGFIFALLYDLILCCCKRNRCGPAAAGTGCQCNCGCPTCSCGPKV